MNEKTTKKIKKKALEFFFAVLLLLGVCIYDTYIADESILNLKSYVEEFETLFREEEVTENEEEIKPVVNTNNNLKISYIDVGQADSILLEQDNEYMLVDAGNNEDGRLLVNYFNELGITKFKYVIGTHAHEDHIGGMDDIIKNFEIEHFYMPDVITTTKTFEDVLDNLLDKKIKFETPNIGEVLPFGESTIDVLYVGKDKADLNNTSIVFKLTYKDKRFLFTGDATSVTEKILLNNNVDLKSDVLKVGHHGSQYSSTAAFLKAVNPKYAVISVGKGNVYDHPKQITLDKLQKLQIITYRTDLNGTIILTTDGKNINFNNIQTNTNG